MCICIYIYRHTHTQAHLYKHAPHLHFGHATNIFKLRHLAFPRCTNLFAFFAVTLRIFSFSSWCCPQTVSRTYLIFLNLRYLTHKDGAKELMNV